MKLEVGGVRLHVVRRGPADGPPVVLVHGFPFDHRMWAHQLEALSDAYRLVAYVGREMARRIPKAELATLPGAGHVGSLERPEAFTAALRRFVEGVGRGGRWGRPRRCEAPEADR